MSMERSDPTAPDRQSRFAETLTTNEAYASGVSWAAVIAGAFVAAALALILLTLGTSLNLSATPSTFRPADITVGRAR